MFASGCKTQNNQGIFLGKISSAAVPAARGRLVNKMEEIASANRAEGERARERGLKYLHLKDFERAIKFLNLSHRLRPSPDTLQIR